jgi:predicted HTH transcriptional regulator
MQRNKNFENYELILLKSLPDMRSNANEDARYVKDLIKQGENQQLDFKFEISNARKMARTFAAFANTEGGKLLVGVKDNGKISGIRTEEEAYMAESAAHVFCKPAVDYNLKKWIVEGKSILEVEIPTSKNRPHFAPDEKGEWIAYVRVGDQNIKANRVQVNVWKKEGRKSGVWLNYGNDEKTLIEYLSENERITLSRFVRIARISRIRAENILVNLILLKVIIMEINEKSVFFRLNPINNRMF